MIKGKKSVLIIGANGFIGNRLVEKLWGDQRYMVVAGIHSWVNVARVARFPVEIRLCDALDKNSLKKSLEGIDIVVNCLAGDRHVIVDNTRLLVEVFRQSKLKKLIYLSSAAVYGREGGEVTEENKPRPVNAYGKAKWEAEKYFMGLCRQGFPAMILRPAIVYGPFSETWTMSLGKTLVERKLGLSDSFDGKCNLLHVDDLVEIILLSLDNDRAMGVFNVNGGEIITWNEYFSLFNYALGLPRLSSLNPVSLSIYRFFPRGVKFLPKRARKFNRIRKYEFYYHIDLSLFNLNAVYSIRRAKRELGFFPKIKIRRSLREISVWMKNIGYI